MAVPGCLNFLCFLLMTVWSTEVKRPRNSFLSSTALNESPQKVRSRPRKPTALLFNKLSLICQYQRSVVCRLDHVSQIYSLLDGFLMLPEFFNPFSKLLIKGFPHEFGKDFKILHWYRLACFDESMIPRHQSPTMRSLASSEHDLHSGAECKDIHIDKSTIFGPEPRDLETEVHKT